MTIGLIPHFAKEKALQVAEELARTLQARGVRVVCEPEVATRLKLAGKGLPYAAWGTEVDLVLVLGGDGTLLAAARQLLPHGLPLLGINLGHLGFLTELELEDLPEMLPAILAGKFHVETRMTLAATVQREGEEIASFAALNDVVITRGAFARIINLVTAVSGAYVSTYPADGLIVASATGSTAYSLSAGGPIVSPRLEAMIITPICAHTLYARSLVIAPDEVVEVTVEAGGEEVMLSLDGQQGFPLADRDRVRVRRGEAVVKLIRLGRNTFYDLMRTRLSEGRL